MEQEEDRDPAERQRMLRGLRHDRQEKVGRANKLPVVLVQGRRCRDRHCPDQGRLQRPHSPRSARQSLVHGQNQADGLPMGEFGKTPRVRNQLLVVADSHQLNLGALVIGSFFYFQLSLSNLLSTFFDIFSGIPGIHHQLRMFNNELIVIIGVIGND